MTLFRILLILSLFGFGISEASFGLDRIDPALVGETDPLEVTIQDYVRFLLGFLSILSVIYGIWGGVDIFRAAGDDELVKKGRNRIIYMILGLAVIFLAGAIVNFVLGSILN